MKALIAGAGLTVLIIAGCTNSDPKKELGDTSLKTEVAAEEVTADAKGTVEEDGYIKYRSAEWSDDFRGLETSINSVSVHLEGNAVIIWMTINNTTEDNTFTTYPTQGYLVTDDGKQYDADIVQSSNLGGEIVSRAEKDGDIVFLTDYKDIQNLSEIRLVWSATDSSDYEKKEYDIKIPLK